MKFLMSLAMVLASGAVLASPAVGDKSLFNVTIEQGGVQILGTYEVSLTGLDSQGNFVMKTVVALEDEDVRASEKTVAVSDLTSDAQVAQILTYCSAYGGKSSTYTLPGAGTVLPTCVLPSQDNYGEVNGEIDIALVPFGLAKQIQVDSDSGQTLTLELQSFTAGK